MPTDFHVQIELTGNRKTGVSLYAQANKCVLLFCRIQISHRVFKHMQTKPGVDSSRFITDLCGETAAGEDVAFLITRTKIVYFSRYKPAPHEPRSAITELVQGVWRLLGTHAVSVIRSRIYSTRQPTEMDYGMVKVCAKRISPIEDFLEDHKDQLSEILKYERVEVSDSTIEPKTPTSQSTRLSLEEALCLANELISKPSALLSKAESARPIAAVLLSKDGDLLASSANRAGFDRTRHAEVNLLQDYFERTKKPVPDGATLVTTRKPCKMCAGMLWHATENPLSLQVLYEEFDPGPLAAKTILNAFSFERNRACKSESEIKIELEKKIEPSND